MNEPTVWVGIVLTVVCGMAGVAAPAAGQGLPVAAPEQVGLSAEKLAEIGPFIQKYIDAKEMSGAITIIARRGKVIHFEAHGLMDVKANKPMQKDAIFRIYSMTKPVVTVAVMKLYEEGKIDLNDPISKYLPALKNLKVGRERAEMEREITISDLLSNTAGLTGDERLVERLWQSKGLLLLSGSTLEEIVEKLPMAPLVHQPGKGWVYSFATEVLARLIEVVHGKPFDASLKGLVCQPLDMRDTDFYVPAEKRDRFVEVYGRGFRVVAPPQPGTGGKFTFEKPPKFLSGGGGLCSTATDYMRFCLMLLNKGTLDGKRYLKTEMIEMMMRNHVPKAYLPISRHPAGRGYGYGGAVRVKKIDSEPSSVGEYEWLGGIGTEFWISPRDELAVVTLNQTMPMIHLGHKLKPLIYNSIEKETRLLLDTRVVDEVENANLTLGTIKKNENNPLFTEDKPWEPRYDNMYPNVIYDEEDKIYKCWYFSFIIEKRTTSTPVEKRNPESTNYMNVRPTGRDEAILYATSKDGIHWEKPELGIVEFQGSKKNNIVCRGPSGAGVLKDLRDPDPKRCYKAFYAAQVGYMQLVRFSPDGLHWGPEIRCPEIAIQSDTHANMIWSPEIQKYIGIVRHYDRVPIVGNRKIARTESADAVKWTKAKLIIEGTPLKQLHDMVIFRDGGVYLGLLGRMHYPSMKSKDGVRQHVELAWSPDSYTWHRICPGTPLIGPTPTEETKYGKMPYDWGCFFASTPIFRDGEIQIYYGACDWYFFDWRKSGLALATLRPDGWAGYEQIDGNKPASITTTPVVCAGDKLQFSADVSGAGSIKVTLLDKENKELAVGEPIKQTVTDTQVKWPEGFSLETLKGNQIRLRFELRDAKLYSFSFHE